MRAFTEYMTMHTRERRELVRLTPKLEKILAASGIQDGMMLVSAMHITAGVFVNDDEPGLHRDIWEWLQKLAPQGPKYAHHDTGEDNGDAHEVTLPITKGQLDLGPWQQVFYAEFDGRRDKRIIIKVLGI
jgi:secondary thiamine-phosphate synthase enzyme